MKNPRFGSLRTVRAELARRGTDVSRQTIANHLKQGHLRARHRTKKFCVSAVNQRNRIQWAVDHVDDSIKTIRKRVYSDEKIFIMNPKSRWVWVDERDPHPVIYKSMCDAGAGPRGRDLDPARGDAFKCKKPRVQRVSCSCKCLWRVVRLWRCFESAPNRAARDTGRCVGRYFMARQIASNYVQPSSVMCFEGLYRPSQTSHHPGHV